MPHRLPFSIGLAAICTLWIAAAGSPATAPAEPDYTSLVKQLSNPDFATREAASAKLMDVGEDARPALEQGAESTDPEVRSRCAALLHRLADESFPGEAPPGFAPEQGELDIAATSAGSRIDVSLRGRVIHIVQDAGNIRVDVSGFVNGKPVTRNYQAADAASLRDQSRQAYDLWREYSARVPPVINGGEVVQRIPLGDPAPFNEVEAIASKLAQQMQDAKLNDRQIARISDCLQKLRQTSQAKDQLSLNDVQRRKRQEDYLSSCDDLRKAISDLGLPDPGSALPPPAASRLGVEIDSSLPLNDGLVVSYVDQTSRGARLGLMPNDLIRAVNGEPIRSVIQLRGLAASREPLVFDITRGGKDVTLRESPQTQPAPAQ